nr:hypothetical protein BaRGS_029708 [Batillaria attramentaria]
MEEDRRAASARLKSYIRGLPTSREKVAPTVMDKNGERKVMLQAHVTVLGVLGVDDVQQTVSTTIFLLLYWQDKSLAWNTSAYEGVDKIFLPMDSVWTPSVNLGNTMSATDVVRSAGNLEVDSEGRAKVQLPLFIETLCSLDLTHYPYDEQVCTILIYTFLEDLEWDAIESSRSDSEQLANALDIGSEWEMVNTSVELTVVSGQKTASPRIVLHVKRKTTFYTVCLVLSMVLTSYMNTLVFLVPLQSGEKVSFLVTICVSTSVFVSYFTTVMPRGLDSVPNTLKLLIGVIVESLIVLLATIVVLRLFHQQQQPNVPDPGKPGTQEAPQDLTHYPYDEQVCSILFYSFLEEFEWAAIESSRAFSQAIANTLELSSEWEMVNTSVHLIIYGEDDELSPKISLHLRRKTTFYTVCLVLPMVLTSYMNTLVFLVPLQSGEKVSFLVTIFVSTSVFVSSNQMYQTQGSLAPKKRHKVLMAPFCPGPDDKF